MPQSDSPVFRELVCRLLPGLNISEVARPSGQRIVYFGDFGDATEADLAFWDDIDVASWGKLAIKISAGIPPASITYLQREIGILSEIESANYPQMHYDNVFSKDPETEEPLAERLFVTIEEFVQSTPLSDCLNDFDTEKKVVELLISIVNALMLLWNRRPPLIHRDLKPDNILIKEDESIVIIDLGIVREEGESGVTLTEAPWGPCTPNFCSPEQAQNDKMNISFKSDVFTLGTLIHVLITKQNPFCPDSSTTVVDVLGRVLKHEPESLKDIAGCTAAFSELVQKMLNKQPYRRPRTPNSLLRSLEAIRDDINEN